MVGGDLTLCKEEGDDFECTIDGIKSGIWKVVSSSEEEILFSWFAEGPLPEDLPSVSELEFAQPELEDEAWVELGSFSVDSGTGGILDYESVLEYEAIQYVGREIAFECFGDLETGPVIPGGLIGKRSFRAFDVLL